MEMNTETEIVFAPSIGLSHIIPTVQFAKLLVRKDHRFSATFLIFSSPTSQTPQPYFESVTDSVPRIRFTVLPQAELPPAGTDPGLPTLSIYMQNYQPLVKEALVKIRSDSGNSVRVRLVVDMFSTAMIDVAKELDVPSYLYYTSGSACFGFMLHLPTLDAEIATEFGDLTELNIPSYINPVPPLALPSPLLNRKSDGYAWFLSLARKFRETKGIIVNSFIELEPRSIYAFNQLYGNIPNVYLVGPLLELEGKVNSSVDQAKHDPIMNWLDDQPESSVVFLCFGTQGTFGAPQVKEIAKGLEQSGQRFLWSLRRPSTIMFGPLGDYTNPEEVLPEGFLERVNGKGLICGWAPQAEVLAHKSIGGFVSHCGWNSTLESLWFGVPMLMWPLGAEQKMNAFELVKDLGLAVEIREGFYKEEGMEVVTADEIERGVKCVMDVESEVRRKVKDMSEKCKNALEKGGSSWSVLGCLIEDLIEEAS